MINGSDMVFVIDRELNDNLRNQICKKYLNGYFEERNGFIGAATLISSTVRLELCIFSAAQVDIYASETDLTPVLSYFAKKYLPEGGWSDGRYLNTSVGVDWAADNWKELLWVDMKKKMAEIKKNDGKKE